MRVFFLNRHRRLMQVFLAGILWIVETCCPEIKVVRGVLLHRSALQVDIIHL